MAVSVFFIVIITSSSNIIIIVQYILLLILSERLVDCNKLFYIGVICYFIAADKTIYLFRIKCERPLFYIFFYKH